MKAQAMKKAWELFKKAGVKTMEAWSQALRDAWAIVKGVVKEVEVEVQKFNSFLVAKFFQWKYRLGHIRQTATGWRLSAGTLQGEYTWDQVLETGAKMGFKNFTEKEFMQFKKMMESDI